MDYFLQQVFAGLASGAIYASLALALVMIYNSTGHINLAQGEMALVSTYGAWTLLEAGLPYPAAFALTVVASFLFGVAIEAVVIRRFKDAPPLSLVVVFVGLLLALNAVAGWVWGYTIKPFPSPVEGWQTGTALVGAHSLFTIAVIGVLLVLLFAFFSFTRTGLALRAASMSPVSAGLSGVRVNRMLALGWGLAAAIGAVGGMLIAPVVFLDPSMMLSVLLYGFAAALLGGLSSPAGAVVGGLLFGVLENLVGAYLLGNDLKLVFALATVIAVLLVRPQGLFGRSVVKRF